MRMRKMKNLEPRMEKCAALRIVAPEEMKGKWRTLKPDATALWVEVGCGKGKFTAETAQANPDVLMIAVERCREAMVVAMERPRKWVLPMCTTSTWMWKRSRRSSMALRSTVCLSTSPILGPVKRTASAV